MLGVVNSMYWLGPVAARCTQVPPLELASDCSDAVPPLTVEARLSASNESGPVVVATFNPTLVLCVRLPLVPRTDSVLLPVGVEAAVVTVSVDGERTATGFGLNAALAPDGKPVTLIVTEPA